MNHVKKRTISVAVVLLPALFSLILNGCGPTTIKQLEEGQNTQQLDASEILELVEANTLYGISYKENIYFYFDQSGALFGTDINNSSDTGHWDVSDKDELCMQMQWWWYGDLRCFPVYTDSEKYYLADSGRLIAYTADVFQGDLKNQYRDLSKNKRKSYRRSIRGNQPDAAPQPKPSSAPLTQPEPDVERHREPIPDVPARELKSTVKWMARDCPDCNLANANLRKAELVAAKLQGANLAGADLSMANLRRANLRGANLTNADLTSANLPGTDLRDADLSYAKLNGANLIRADLTGTNLKGADLEGALLDGVKGMTR